MPTAELSAPSMQHMARLWCRADAVRVLSLSGRRQAEVETEALGERIRRRFADLELLARSWPTGRGAPRTRARSPTSGSSSSATPCSGLVVTDHVYRTYPELPEGQLAKVRAAVVNAGALAEVAASSTSATRCCLGKGEDASGGREKPSILADAMEAVIGAVYLDGGWDAARELVIEPAGRAHGRGGRRARRPGLQDPAPGAGGPHASTTCPATRSWARARPRQAVLGHRVHRRRRSGARARAGPRSRPSRRRPAWPGTALGHEHRHGRGPAMPELPEVETIRRDLEKEVVGKRIREVEVTGMRSIRRHPNKKHFVAKLEGGKITGVERRGKYLLVRARRAATSWWSTWA